MKTPNLRIRLSNGSVYIIHKMGEIQRTDMAHTLGEIQRTDMAHTPSGNWNFLGITHVKRNETLSLNKLQFLAETSQLTDWTKKHLLYKNGKPQWTGLDVDHGTRRTWGLYGRITSITI